MAKTFELSIEIKVAQCWIDDGFDATTPAWKEGIENAIRELMPHARGYEFVVTVKKAEIKTRRKKAG